MHYVYVAQEGTEEAETLVKVGVSATPIQRANHIGFKEPIMRALFLYDSKAAAYYNERSLHQALSPYQLASEYYRLDEHIITVLEQLSDCHPFPSSWKRLRVFVGLLCAHATTPVKRSIEVDEGRLGS